MPHLLRRLLFSLAALLLSGSALKATEMQEIIVTATRTAKPLKQTPVAVSIVSAQQVQLALPQLGLDESLNRVPGLFLQNRFNFAQDLRISIRGFGARASFGIRGIRIFVDGIPETLADGQGSVDSIDLSSIHNIEILRGAAASLYGNASGGVINIQSETGGDTPALEARISGGEFGYLKSQVKATGKAGKLDYLLSLADLRIDGYRNHSAARNQLLNVRARVRLSDQSALNIVAAATRQPQADDPGGITRNQARLDPRSARERNVLLGAGEDLSQAKIGWNFAHTMNNPSRDTLTLRNYFSRRDFAGFIPTTDGAIGIDRLFAGAGIKYNATRVWGNTPHALTMGIDYDRQDDDRTRYLNDAGARGVLLLNQTELVENLGVFIQDDLILNDRASVSLGARFDTVRFDLTDRFLSNGNASGVRRMRAVSPMLGVSYTPTADLNLYGNIASSFESPTTTELALIGGGLNAALEPQLATNYEIGLRGEIRAWRSVYELNVFYIDVQDELIPFEQADGSDLFTNAGESQRRGLEAAWSIALSDSLRIAATYTYADYQFDRFTDSNGNDYSGNTLPGVPDHLAQLNLDYQNAAGLFVALELQRVGEIALNNANSEFAAAHTIANIRSGLIWQAGNWEATPFFGVANVTDIDYFANTRINAFGGRYFEPGPKRNLYGGVGVKYRFNKP